MNKTEQEILKTLKTGLGLTSAEQEILTNYIDKLQEENNKLKYEQLEADELIKALEGKDEELERELLYWKGQYHLLSRKIDCISKDKIREKIKELEEYKNKDILCNSRDYFQFGRTINVLKELLEEN